MVEAVRLLVWDLDETFWKGTLTEGGIEYVDAHHDIVVELARRGILNSICSKNDFEPVKAILEAKGLWPYFVFPSIDWEPKGPRLAALVEAVHLRAASIMLIDDNALNRNETVFFVPDMQVADVTILPTLLSDPRFKGKPDHKLTRLAQYKLLETRSRDMVAGADNRAFLRSSDIRVTIEHDLEPHLDRVIELINRTNQLNFTKKRLPEDAEAARLELCRQLSQFNVQAGLVHVRDRYGDYGYVGVYVMSSDGAGAGLSHYCFSCRTQGMDVETWLYERLGRPRLNVQGEVLTDIFAPHDAIDWINASGAAATDARERLAGRILVRGGCDMRCITHYLALNAEEVVGEFNLIRAGLPVRLDHAAFLRYAFSGVSAEAVGEARRLGYRPEDFRSALADDPASFDACVFSFWINANHAVYTHPSLPLGVPVGLAWGDNSLDVRERRQSDYQEHKPTQSLLDVIEVLREGYTCTRPSAAAFRDNLEYVLARIPTQCSLFFVLAIERLRNKQGKEVSAPHFIAQNQAIADAVAERANVHLLRIADFVHSPEEIIDWTHFNRMVYFRIYQSIALTLRVEKERGLADKPWPRASRRPGGSLMHLLGFGRRPLG